MRVLVFGTNYCGAPDRLALLEQWAEALERVAPDCDHLIVDSQSPVFDTAGLPWLSRFGPRRRCPSMPAAVPIDRRTAITFPESVGHLAAGGRDGWGRAFTQGLLCAMAGSYDFVVHVEGDLLTRLDLGEICAMMAEHRIAALGAITPMFGWLELGLMFFAVEHVRRTRLVERYDWANRKPLPYPEIFLAELLGPDLFLQAWRGAKDDQALQKYFMSDLHWITKSADPVCYADFMKYGPWPVRRPWPAAAAMRQELAG
jgi:hypothetical protein